MNAHTHTPPIRGSLISELKQLPKPFYLLVAGTFISRFGNFVIPFLTIYIRQLGFAPVVTGYTLAAYGAGGFAASIAGGYLADRIGRKPTLLISCAGTVASMLLLSAARSAPGLIAGTAILGLMGGLFYPASSSLIADLVAAELRVRAFAVQRFAMNLAFALGMATAGIVASSSFFWLFMADAGSTVILGLIILFGLERGIGRKPAGNAGWGVALRSISRNGPFLRASVASFLVAMIFWQTSSTFGLQVTQLSGMDERAFGFLLGINGIMIVLLELPLTSWTRRWNPRRMIALGYSLVGLGLALLAFNASLPMLVASIVVLTIGEMISLPINSTYVANLAPDAMRGRYMGVVAFSWSTAVGLGPMIGMWVFARSPEALWVLCGAAGLAAAAIILVRPAGKLPRTETCDAFHLEQAES